MFIQVIKMKRLILILIIFISGIIKLFPQDNEKYAGLSFDFYPSVLYKTINDSYLANEFFITIKYEGLQFTCLREKYYPELVNINNIDFYYGYGFHLGFVSNVFSYYDDVPFFKPIYRHGLYPVLGLDFITGIEYHLQKYPFMFGMEYKPYFDINGPNYFNMHIGCIAFSIKYCFNY